MVCVCCRWQNNSVSPSDSLRAASEKHRSSSDYGLDSKKRKVDDKDNMSRYVSVCLHWFLLFEADPEHVSVCIFTSINSVASLGLSSNVNYE